LRPAQFEFEFPIILHLSEDGQSKMLTDVTLLKTVDGACSDSGADCTSDAECPQGETCAGTGNVVLKTPDCPPTVCDGTLVGALTVNGQPFARRVSTAAYSFGNDLVLNGDLTSTLSASVTVTADDPLNPFRHKFHPDHDGVDQFGDPIPGEVFEFTRAFVLAFASEPPEGESVLDWGDSVVGGTYSETASGLHKESITTQGRFRLHRVSDIGVLNAPVNGGNE
jgi:hypothetical protein